MNEQGQDEIEFTSQILYYPQKIQKKKKQKKKKKKHLKIIGFILALPFQRMKKKETICLKKYKLSNISYYIQTLNEKY